MSEATSSKPSPRVSTLPASIAQAMNASSGSALCPTRIDHRGHVTLVTMPRAELSESIQDYLKSVYKLQAEHGRVTIGALAKDQSVSPASASAMVKKLAALDLLEHEPYRGAQLTDSGERVALEVIRHHRLLELYLAKTLGLHVDDVHDEADRLEHVISEELEARIDRALGFPTHDPHGDPIPDANLNWPARKADVCRWRQLRPKKKRSRGARSSSRRNGLTLASAPSSSETTASSSSVAVRGLEAVLELVALPHVVVRARRLALAMLGIHLAADGPHRAGPPLDPDHDPLGAPAVVAPFHDPFGEAPGCHGGLHASTIQSPSQWESSMQSRARSRFCRHARRARSGWPQYVIREHHRGRPLAEILQDHYVTNRCSPGADPAAPRPARRRARARRRRRRRGKDPGRRVANPRARRRAPQPRCPRPRARST